MSTKLRTQLDCGRLLKYDINTLRYSDISFVTSAMKHKVAIMTRHIHRELPLSRRKFIINFRDGTLVSGTHNCLKIVPLRRIDLLYTVQFDHDAAES